MKELRVSKDVITITDLKKNLDEVMNTVSKEGRPVLVTRRGWPAGVIVPPEEYERFSGLKLTEPPFSNPTPDSASK